MHIGRLKHKWGEMKVVRENGTSRFYKDAVVWYNGSRTWDWNVSGTRHTPGIQIADLKYLMRCDIVILSRGVDGRLNVPSSTLCYLEQHNKEVHVLKTPDAVRLFNRLLREGEYVGGLFHSTC